MRTFYHTILPNYIHQSHPTRSHKRLRFLSLMRIIIGISRVKITKYESFSGLASSSTLFKSQSFQSNINMLRFPYPWPKRAQFQVQPPSTNLGKVWVHHRYRHNLFSSNLPKISHEKIKIWAEKSSFRGSIYMQTWTDLISILLWKLGQHTIWLLIWSWKSRPTISMVWIDLLACHICTLTLTRWMPCLSSSLYKVKKKKDNAFQRRNSYCGRSKGGAHINLLMENIGC